MTPDIRFSKRDSIILAAILLLKLGLQVALIKAGFFAVGGDDYLRQLIGHEWSQAPFFASEGLGRPSILWMPAPFWFYGMANWLVGDIWLAPVAVNLVFGLAGVAAIFALTKRLAGTFEASLAAILAAGLPWHVWMSVSALADPPYQVAMIVGLLLLIRWEQTDRTHHKWLFGSSAAMLFGTMVRPEAWLFACAFGAYLGWIFLRDKSLRWIAFAAAALPFLFVLVWMVHNYRIHGNPAEFLGEARSSMDREVNEVDSLPIRIALFPVLLVVISPLITTIALAWLGVRGFRRQIQGRDWASFLIVLGSAFLILILGLVFGLGTNTTPQRFVVIFALLLCPVAAIALGTLWRNSRLISKIAGAGLFSLALLWGLSGSFRYPDDFRDQAEAGQALREILDSGQVAGDGLILTEDNLLAAHGILPQNLFDRVRVQCRDWAVKSMSNHPERFPLSLRDDCVWSAETAEQKTREALASGEVGVILARREEALDLIPEEFRWAGSGGGIGIFVFVSGSSQVQTPEGSEGISLKSFQVGPGVFPRHIETVWKIDRTPAPGLAIKIRYLDSDDGSVIKEVSHAAFHPAYFRGPSPGAREFAYRIPFPEPEDIAPGFYDLEISFEGEGADSAAAGLGSAWVVPSKRDALKAFVNGSNRDLGMLIRVLMSL